MKRTCDICGDVTDTRRVVLSTPEKVDEDGPHTLEMNIDVCLFCYREEQTPVLAEAHPWGALPEGVE